MNQDPRVLLDQARMGTLQIAAVAMCIILIALDGFDVLAISFAAPGIAEEWSVDRGALGIVLSMELIGMSFGSIIIGALADRFGRRPAMLGCLVLMSVGMYLASTANSVVELSVYRFFTGLGIGGMLASANAMAAEFSNLKRRNLSVALMAAGYPLGVIIGGSIASMLLVSFDWRAIFLFGAIATGVFIPLTWFLLPESIANLLERRPVDALARVNHTLRRMGHAAIDALPEVRKQAPRSSIKTLFSPRLARTTVLLTCAYFAHIMTFYFTLKWIPKIVVDMGFAPSLAGSVLVWASVGGLAGSLLLGLLSQRYNVKKLVITALLLGAGTVAWFGQEHDSLLRLTIIAAAVGFFTNGAVVGLYAMFAQSFPTAVRAGGTGFVIGVGRGGSAAGPIIAGFLFAAGAGLPIVAVLMGLGSLLGALMLVMLRSIPEDN